MGETDNRQVNKYVCAVIILGRRLQKERAQDTVHLLVRGVNEELTEKVEFNEKYERTEEVSHVECETQGF